jgi:hypothetical protein
LGGGIGAFALSLALFHLGAETTSVRDRTFRSRIALASVALAVAAAGGSLPPLGFVGVIGCAVLGQLLLEARTPRTGLPDREWAIMVTHTIEGQKILDQVGGFMTKVGLIVRSHHERWDGNGYPDGLAGDEIPLAARIVTCCDSWNAMRTDRAYRRALTHEDAVTELIKNSGTQFDPQVIEAFLRMIDRADDAVFHALGGRPQVSRSEVDPVPLAA